MKSNFNKCSYNAHCYIDTEKLFLAEELQNSRGEGFLHIQAIIWCNEKRKCATVRLLINLA